MTPLEFAVFIIVGTCAIALFCVALVYVLVRTAATLLYWLIIFIERNSNR